MFNNTGNYYISLPAAMAESIRKIIAKEKQSGKDVKSIEEYVYELLETEIKKFQVAESHRKESIFEYDDIDYDFFNNEGQR